MRNSVLLTSILSDMSFCYCDRSDWAGEAGILAEARACFNVSGEGCTGSVDSSESTLRATGKPGAVAVLAAPASCLSASSCLTLASSWSILCISSCTVCLSIAVSSPGSCAGSVEPQSSIRRKGKIIRADLPLVIQLGDLNLSYSSQPDICIALLRDRMRLA